MKKNIRIIAVLIACMMCVLMAACGNGSQRSWPVEALTAEEFTYYADNANVFADSVLESGAKFLYVQLSCLDDGSMTAEELAVANDNADGILAMISGDYHDVLDARENVGDIGSKLGLATDAKILVIGDNNAELQVYEKLAETYNNIDYLNSIGVSSEDYDKIYDNATTAGWDLVIVANDVAAFHAESFPFEAE